MTMANSIKLESCPKCGAALASNLVKLLKTDPENYVCPGGSTDSRKDWETQWAEDWNKEQMASITEQSLNLNDVAEPTVTGAI